MLAALLFVGLASAATPEEGPRLFRLMGGLGGGLSGAYAGGTPPGQGASAGGHLVGRALLQLPRVAGDFGVREGLYTDDLRSVGALFFGLRWTPAHPLSARLGFAHHHEVPDEVLFDTPVGAVAGTAEGIRHRSGAELGLGWHLPIDAVWEPGRLGAQVELSAAVLGDDQGPRAYGFVDLLFTLDAGPRLAR